MNIKLNFIFWLTSWTHSYRKILTSIVCQIEWTINLEKVIAQHWKMNKIMQDYVNLDMIKLVVGSKKQVKSEAYQWLIILIYWSINVIHLCISFSFFKWPSLNLITFRLLIQINKDWEKTWFNICSFCLRYDIHAFLKETYFCRAFDLL